VAITNHERVGKALDLLRDGLRPFVERELKAKHGPKWETELRALLSDRKLGKEPAAALDDVAVLLFVMDKQWGVVFGAILGKAERNFALELMDARNRWAHQGSFSTDDTYRVIDSACRLLTSVSAPQAEEVEKIRMELLRVRYDDQVRGEKRKSAGTAIESTATGLKPWREIVTPHKDVASGKYQQAEFAADLWQVHIGEGTEEYRDPTEFFRRTYLTESLKGLLVNAVQRVSGSGGDPVVQLQTNFGGGKTHSMLALYHLFSGTAPGELAGVDALLEEAGVSKLPKVKRVVLVGNKLRPGNRTTKPDGTEVSTLWGELAWQLGGKKAYDRLKSDDRNATNPGDLLRELFVEYGPCLILIDEWVAYARQLHDQSDLPAGGFETQFTFAQALTESAKLAKNCLLVISLPASDTTGSPHTHADDVEVGGERGRAALDRLRNVVGRVESSWRPATAEEGFEIVRRRLFEPLIESSQFKDRDVTARAFSELYRSQQAEFPPECRTPDYEKRIQAAFPIHPEIFDRLYTDWSTLVKFQRTRGVLRLMAAVIYSLWEKGDRNPLIMPAHLPIDDPRVQSELTRYLPDHWPPVIEKDVDGPNSLPLRIDSEKPGTLGKFQAARRVARTIYLGSAPSSGAAHRGLEDRQIRLGCVMPGESPAVFGDAMKHLTSAATYLYQDGTRYWYSTQPTVTKLAEDRAEQLKRDPDKVSNELEARLRADLKRTGDFGRLHPLPSSSGDVPDDLDARLVVLGMDHAYSKDSGNAAESEAQAILESRGNSPRLFRNTLVFLVPDRNRLQDLQEAIRRYLAWESILNDRIPLDMTPFQVRQAETQRAGADSAVLARLPETYQWLLVPTQKTPSSPIAWEALKLGGQDALAIRASKKLKSEELLIGTLAGTRLRMELDRIPLWRDNHVSVRQLVEDFATYTYLPRVADGAVIAAAVRSGAALLTWEQDSFAVADSYDEAAGRYCGLRSTQTIEASADSSVLLVKPVVAKVQLDADAKERAAAAGADSALPAITGDGLATITLTASGTGTLEPKPTRPTRFHGSIALDPTRVGRDAGKIAEEVISHLSGLVGAEVEITLEISAVVREGVPESIVRTVTENARTLKFTSQGFEGE